MTEILLRFLNHISESRDLKEKSIIYITFSKYLSRNLYTWGKLAREEQNPYLVRQNVTNRIKDQLDASLMNEI